MAQKEKRKKKGAKGKSNLVSPTSLAGQLRRSDPEMRQGEKGSPFRLPNLITASLLCLRLSTDSFLVWFRASETDHRLNERDFSDALETEASAL